MQALYRHCRDERERERERTVTLTPSSPFLLLTIYMDARDTMEWNSGRTTLDTIDKDHTPTGTRNDHETAPCVGVHKLSKLDQHLTRPYGAEVVC